jgi:hypothetical protein
VFVLVVVVVLAVDGAFASLSDRHLLFVDGDCAVVGGVYKGRSIKDSESSAGSENLVHLTAATGNGDLWEVPLKELFDNGPTATTPP